MDGRQRPCCSSLPGRVIDKQSPKNVLRNLVCRAKLRFCSSHPPSRLSALFAKMDDQAHKPHRKSKERKEKKGKSGGAFCVPPYPVFPVQADRRFQSQTQKLSPSTDLANSRSRLRVQATSRKSDSMFPSSTDFPMNLPQGSWPSSALPASARPRS